MTKDYIGVKKVTAWKQEKDGKPGYAVKYEDGYISWSPEDVFERFYFPLENGHENRISKADVERFLGPVVSDKFDDKTTISVAETAIGFRQIETSSCVDPASYDGAVGAECNSERMENTVWNLLGFVMQWATRGINRSYHG